MNGAASPGLVVSGRLTVDDIPLIGSVDLHLAGGAIHVFVGPSGVGKSSLLRVLAGLPGAAALEGRCTADDGGPIDGRVAYMGQTDLLAPWLTARQNVCLGPRLRGQPADETRADALLAAVGLDDRARSRPAELSGGMRQRVALARTLMEDRPIVLLDEPFSALDAGTRARMQQLAVQLLRGRTVVLVTHDPGEAVRMADTLHLIRAGAVEPMPVPPGAPVRALDSADVQAGQGALWRRLHDLAG